jgi:tRNA pseudouridine38-40 synthase
MMPSGLRRIALLLEYDGSRYAGSQLQANAATIQGVLEKAIQETIGAAARVEFAGRTDAGVHAYGQVASFVTVSRHSTEVFERALNARLPEDVAVKGVAEVDVGFDVRRQARRRHYRYLLDNGRVRPALDRQRAWHVATPLDVESMTCAARLLVGRHDFAAFASRLEDPEASTVRELFSFDVCKTGQRVSLDVTGNAFLPHQVRRMTGALVEVGKGKLSVEAYTALLKGEPASTGPAAPAHGLYLVRVEYDVDPFGVDEPVVATHSAG